MQQSIPAIVVNYRDNARPSSHYLSTESQCPYTETRPRHSDTTYLQNPSVHTQPQRQGQAIETTLSYRISVSTHTPQRQGQAIQTLLIYIIPLSTHRDKAISSNHYFSTEFQCTHTTTETRPGHRALLIYRIIPVYCRKYVLPQQLL